MRLGLLRRVGLGRGTRYVPLSFWLTMMSDVAEWAVALVLRGLQGGRSRRWAFRNQ